MSTPEPVPALPAAGAEWPLTMTATTMLLDRRSFLDQDLRERAYAEVVLRRGLDVLEVGRRRLLRAPYARVRLLTVRPPLAPLLAAVHDDFGLLVTDSLWSLGAQSAIGWLDLRAHEELVHAGLERSIETTGRTGIEVTTFEDADHTAAWRTAAEGLVARARALRPGEPAPLEELTALGPFVLFAKHGIARLAESAAAAGLLEDPRARAGAPLAAALIDTLAPVTTAPTAPDREAAFLRAADLVARTVRSASMSSQSRVTKT